MKRIALIASTLVVLVLGALVLVRPSMSPLKLGQSQSELTTFTANAPQESRRPNVSDAAAPRAAAPAAAPAPGQAAGSAVAAVTVPPMDRMIIRTVSLTMSVNDVAEAYRQVELITDGVGGSVTSSTFKQDGERMSATLALRIPADQRSYNLTMEQLRKLAVRVPEESLSSQDVTEEFVDLESTLRNLQVTEARLVGLMDRAQKVDEVIAIQRELTGIRGQIERLEGRRRFLERRSEFTTINVTLREIGAPSTRTAGSWSPQETLEEALTALGRSLQGVARVGIWLVVWLPAYGLPLLGVWLLARYLRGRRPVPQA